MNSDNALMLPTLWDKNNSWFVYRLLLSCNCVVWHFEQQLLLLHHSSCVFCILIVAVVTVQTDCQNFCAVHVGCVWIWQWQWLSIWDNSEKCAGGWWWQFVAWCAGHWPWSTIHTHRADHLMKKANFCVCKGIKLWRQLETAGRWSFDQHEDSFLTKRNSGILFDAHA